MPNELIRHNGALPSVQSQAQPLALRFPYRPFLTARQRREQLPAHDAAARVEAAAGVASAAMMHGEVLAHQMTRAVENAPAGAPYYQGFLDAYAYAAQGEICGLFPDGGE